MPINRCLKIPIQLWRRCAAPFLPPACRFYPSCSQYALEALDRHPWPKALGLIAWRLLRCNPFCQCGYDPVPAGGNDLPFDSPRTGAARDAQNRGPVESHDPSRKAVQL